MGKNVKKIENVKVDNTNDVCKWIELGLAVVTVVVTVVGVINGCNINKKGK